MDSTNTLTPAGNPDVLSPTATVVDLQAALESSKKEKAPSFKASITGETENRDEPEAVGASIKLTQRKKWTLLLVFSLAMFVDSECAILQSKLDLTCLAVWSYSAFFIFISPISEDLNVRFQQQSWIIVGFLAMVQWLG